MKKMIKLNNKGFALAETLITAVFVMFIFSVIYTNYTPIMAEYERRETYDDIDGKYAAYWMKKIIEESGDSRNSASISGATLTDNCNSNTVWGKYKNICNELVRDLEIQAVYITGYTLNNKENIVNLATDDSKPYLEDYLEYLPEYTRGSQSGETRRVIIEMVRKNNGEVTSSTGATQVNEIYAYSTIGVR